MRSTISPTVMNLRVSPNSTLHGTSFTCSGDGYGEFMSTSQLEAPTSTILPTTRSPLTGMYCPAKGTTLIESGLTVLMPSWEANILPPSEYVPTPAFLLDIARSSPGTTTSLTLSLESLDCICLTRMFAINTLPARLQITKISFAARSSAFTFISCRGENCVLSLNLLVGPIGVLSRRSCPSQILRNHFSTLVSASP
jgi:hypothetical protein